MPGWRWILTPGHTPGHIALYRAEDGVLLAGDACSTVNMDSWLDKALNRSQLWRAGTPYIYDWNQAKDSVRLLARLQPRVLACGYGRPMSDPHVARRLGAFAESFPVPCHGRYVETPAEVGPTGVTYLPQPALDRLVWLLGGVAIALLRPPSQRLSEPRHTRHNLMSRSDRSRFRATRASFRA
jgi:glyoxylase-like metal-dependent hydrolase (beta-lactamase superfamily II)